MFARKFISTCSPRNVGWFAGSRGFFVLECIFSNARPKMADSHVQLLSRRSLTITSVSLLPRSEHFKYVGNEIQTPRQVAVLARKARKKEKKKTSRRGLKDTLEEKLKEERLKEDTEEMIEMVRKRLQLKEKDVTKLHLNVDYLLMQKIPFPVISRMCNVAPRTIALDTSLLKKKITVFKVNSFFEESLAKVFKKNPRILLRDVESTLTLKVEALRRLPFGFSVDEVVSILERCPDIIEYLNTNKMLEKVKFLEEKIGFSKKQVRKILLKYPAILTMNMINAKEKVDFCLKKFNSDLDKIARYPRILQSQMNRLKERYEYLEHEGIAAQDVKVRGWAFKGIAANSDVYFAERIAQKPLKKLRDFQTSRNQGVEATSDTQSANSDAS